MPMLQPGELGLLYFAYRLSIFLIVESGNDCENIFAIISIAKYNSSIFLLILIACKDLIVLRMGKQATKKRVSTLMKREYYI
jgi:hypothetical protein